MTDPKIVRVEWGQLLGERPRAAGSNAHMQPLGGRVRVPVARVTLDDGSSGWGLSRVDEGVARGLVGAMLGQAYDVSAGVSVRFRPIEYAVWDLVGRREGEPVYAVYAAPQLAGDAVEAVIAERDYPRRFGADSRARPGA